MVDLEMKLCSAKSVATTFTSDAYDFRQVAPNSGAWADPVVVVIHPTKAGTGAGASNSVTFVVEDSENGSSYATLVQSAAIPGADIKRDIVIPLPVRHRQYVRLKTTVAGTVTGTVDAYLSTGYNLPMEHKKEGIDVVKTAD